MNPLGLPPLIAVTAMAAVATVLLLPVLAGQLLQGRLIRAARTGAAILLLTAIGLTAAIALAHTQLLAMPPP